MKGICCQLGADSVLESTSSAVIWNTLAVGVKSVAQNYGVSQTHILLGEHSRMWRPGCMQKEDVGWEEGSQRPAMIA